jgi:hypothetical protein
LSNLKKKVVSITWTLTTFGGPHGLAPQIQKEILAGDLSQLVSRRCQ